MPMPKKSLVKVAGDAYVALRRLTDKSGQTTFAEVGEACGAVPEVSLPWLVEQGLVVKPEELDAAEREALEARHDVGLLSAADRAARKG